MDLGICVRDAPLRDLADLGRFAEDNGYAEVWVPDGARGAGVDAHGKLTGRDAFCGLAAMFAATEDVCGGVGVAAVPMHQPLTLALLASTLTEASGGRFSLGVGVSHPELTARHGLEFPANPISYMAEWVRDLRRRSADEMAFGSGWPVLLAALGPQMVGLGARHADGLVLNWLTPEQAATSVTDISAAASTGVAPRTVLYLRLMPRSAAEADAAAYDGLANYRRHFRAQGLSTVDDIVAGTTLSIDDIPRARARIEEYRESGLDLLCLYPHAVEPGRRNEVLAALSG